MSGCGTKAVQDGLPCTSGWLQGNVGCLGAGQKQFRTDCPALQDGCRGMWDVWVRDKSSSGRTDLHFRMAAGECEMSGCRTDGVQDGLSCTSGETEGVHEMSTTVLVKDSQCQYDLCVSCASKPQDI